MIVSFKEKMETPWQCREMKVKSSPAWVCWRAEVEVEWLLLSRIHG
jgi:hypothetical protein